MNQKIKATIIGTDIMIEILRHSERQRAGKAGQFLRGGDCLDTTICNDAFPRVIKPLREVAEVSPKK